MFKILSTYIWWKIYIKFNIWWVAVRPSYMQDARFLKLNVELIYHQFYDYSTVSDYHFITFVNVS
jgi:hypothetical protein